MAKARPASYNEVEALREEVRNLAGQVNSAVKRIVELEAEKAGARECGLPGQGIQDEVRVLRQEVTNVAAALDKAVRRIRDLEKLCGGASAGENQ